MIKHAEERRHALVIGGSMAGLLAARVLADHFDHVTIIDRDHFPDGPSQRVGVPQSRHVHILLQHGQELLEHYFPGFMTQLVERGAHRFDFVAGTRLYAGSQWEPQFHADIPFCSCSRSLVEWTTRTALQYLPNVAFLLQHEVTGLTVSADATHVTGVSVRERTGQSPASSQGTIMPADFVVDASGRHSHAPDWLQQAGFPAPTETCIDPHLGYATRAYRLPHDSARTWKTLYIMLDPPHSLRGGLLTMIEGDRWLVTLAGAGGEYPPTTEAEFMAFMRSLPQSALYDALKGAEPLSPIVGYRDTQNQYRHYERLTQQPERFIVLGDAAVAFNPVYGQGMTVVAMEAALLDRLLRRQHSRIRAGFARRFQRALARQVAVPWQFSSTADALVPGATGVEPSLTTTLLNGYLERLLRIMPQSRRALVAFCRVIHMTASLLALFHLAIVARVLLAPRRPVSAQ